MKYTELKSEEEIYRVLEAHWHMNEDSLLPPMFHGTDYSLIEISKQERKKINDACEVIIKAVFNLFKENNISTPNTILSSITSEHDNAGDAFINAEQRLKNNPSYRYGDFYVSNDPLWVTGYSKEAWILGETGETANMLVKGALGLGLELPKGESFEAAFKILEERRKRTKNPIILIITDCAYSDLYSVGGNNVKNNENLYMPNGIKYLKSKKIADSFIIDEKALDGVGFYFVRINLYDELIRMYRRI